MRWLENLNVSPKFSNFVLEEIKEKVGKSGRRCMSR